MVRIPLRLVWAGTIVVGLGAASALITFSARTARAQQGSPPSVDGTVRVAHPPAAAPIRATVQADVCGATVPNDEVVVGPGNTLVGAVVWLEGASGPATATATTITLRLDQHGCRFVPHVSAVMVGSTVGLVSSDPCLHNVHAYQGDQTLFNIALPVSGVTVGRQLAEPGLVTVRCDVHNWMKAYVYVFDNPFHAVTSQNGTFHIAGVAPGTYPVHVWHERLGERTGSVTVTSAGSARVDFSY